MSGTAKSKKSLGQFYQVDAEGDQEIAEHGGSRLVLARWALRRHQQRYSNVVCAGRRVLIKTLGMGFREAERALNDLRSIAWGRHPHECALIDAAKWNEQCRSGKDVPLGPWEANKVMPFKGDRLVALPNQLNKPHKGQDKTPLQQLYDIRDDTLRDDTVALLRGLYEHLDMKLYGGVDPSTAMYFDWRNEGELFTAEGTHVELGYLGSTGGLHYWATDTRKADDADWRDPGTSQHKAFIESVTNETSDAPSERFCAATDQLIEMGLIYHVGIVFDRDPTENRNAHVMYPLWIFNTSERNRLESRGEAQAGLAVQALKKAYKADLDPDLNEALNNGYAQKHKFDGPLTFFVAAADTPKAEVVGIVRPRFVPNTMDSQGGWAELKTKSAEWLEKLS